MNVVVFFAVLLFPQKLPTCPPNQTQPTTQFDAENYWFLYAADALRDRCETGTEIRAATLEYDRLTWFRVFKRGINSVGAKTCGYKQAVWQLARSAFPQRGAETQLAKLKILTGVEVKPVEWPIWFRENARYMIWSEKEGRLVVDQQAKRAGVRPKRLRGAVESDYCTRLTESP